MSLKLTIALPVEALVAIEASGGNRVAIATNTMVAAAVVDGLDMLYSQRVNSAPAAAQSQPQNYMNIKFLASGTTHLVALTTNATLTSLRDIIVVRTGRPIRNQSSLLYKKCQIGGTAGEDGAEANTPLHMVSENYLRGKIFRQLLMILQYGILNGSEIEVKWV